MFTGIIETTGEVVDVVDSGSNRVFSIRSTLTGELHIDQSLAHNGACLTITATDTAKSCHKVTAIHETLARTSLGGWQIGTVVNLERSMPANGRLDGHFVQGHVDAVGLVEEVIGLDGSHEYIVRYPTEFRALVVQKGSVTLDGISLTIADSFGTEDRLKVSIIPYTFENTAIHNWQKGCQVNIEFDILAKFVQKQLQLNEQ